MNITTIRGFKDILPNESPMWRKIEKKTRLVFESYGLSELRVPIVEKTELFARGIGEVTDIVEKEMYTFRDRRDELITLRPEATAGFVRAIIENHLVEIGRATKLYHFGPMFRYERPQKGRQRQFHQINVEVFGDYGPHIDAELIAMLNTLLNELGLFEIETHLNSLGCLKCRPIYREKLIDFLTKQEDELCADCQRRLYINPLRVIDCKAETCQKLVIEAPILTEHLCLDCLNHFDKVVNLLEIINIKYILNPKLVRGLDYYNRTAFEVLSGSLGAQNAVAGGGRYDGLCKNLGGPDIPGIGFAIGMERLVMLLSEEKKVSDLPPDFYIAILCPEAIDYAFNLTQKLRLNGYRVTCDWESASLKSRLRRADRLNATEVIMIGPLELEEEKVTLRDLKTGDQRQISLKNAFNL